MSDEQVSIAKSSCKRQNFSIVGATGSVNCQCCVSSASIKLRAWSDDHVFIKANPVNRTRNSAVTNHANDTLIIGGMDIHVFNIGVIGNPWLTEDMRDELSHIVKCEVNTLELPSPP